MNRLLTFVLFVILLFCQFTYAEQQISQFGITWTFNRDYTVGQFANGDYWVLGPVTIIGIDPPSIEIDGRTMNGSMVNPSPKLARIQGYDSSMYGGYGRYFDPNLNAGRPNNQDLTPRQPLVLQPHSSLVSTISIPEPGLIPQLRTAAILTVLPEPVPEGSFRPPYCGTNKTIKFNKDQLDYSLLANLKPVPGAPGIVAVERYFERPWIDHIPGWMGRYHHPAENMPDYGREISIQVGIGALKLNLNLTNQMKEVLLIRFVQLGIDLYGIVQDRGKHNWVNSGGHASGRKWPILFAGIILNDPDIKAIGTKSGDYLYDGVHGPGNAPGDYIHFGEDDQTFYVKDSDIYSSPYELHHIHDVYVNHGKVNVVEGSTTVTGVDTTWTSAAADTAEHGNYFAVEYGKAAERGYNAYQYKVISVDTSNQTLELDEPFQGYTENNVDYVISKRPWFGHGNYANYEDFREFTDEHKGMPEWGISYATNSYTAGLDWGAAYRQSSTANAWGGFILTAHIMGVKELWNHDALFDYMDRYMEVQKQVVGVGHWTRQRPKFIENMWDAYRPDYGPVWTMSPILNIAATGGSVTKTSDKVAYDLCEKVILRAVADDGYEFAGWSGDFSGTGNPVTIIMHANRTVTANFATRNNTPTHNSK